MPLFNRSLPIQNALSLITLGAALCLLSACSDTNDAQDKILTLVLADPVNDAKSNVARGKLSFIAVHNHHLIEPINVPECLFRQHGYTILSNESFDNDSLAYQQYGAVSLIYANWYNNAVYESLQLRKQAECKKEHEPPTPEIVI